MQSHDPNLPGWNLELSSWGRFHPAIACKHVLNYFFTALRPAEVIIWKNLIPAKWDPGSTKEGSHVATMSFFTYNHRI